MTGVRSRDDARSLDARVLVLAVAAPVLLILALCAGSARLSAAGLPAAGSPMATDSAAATTHATLTSPARPARVLPVHKATVHLHRVAVAIGGHVPFAFLAGAALALLPVLVPGRARAGDPLRPASPGLAAARAPPVPLA